MENIPINTTAQKIETMANKQIDAEPILGSSNLVESGGVAKAIQESGGGTTDYTDLTNKPKINGIELSGDQTSAQLGIEEGMSQETAQGMFANIIRNEAEGTVISVNDVSPFPQIVETKVESANLFDYQLNDTVNCEMSIDRGTNEVTFTSNGVGVSFYQFKIKNLIVGEKYTVSITNFSNFGDSVVASLLIGNTSAQDEHNYGLLSAEQKSVTFLTNSSELYIKGYAAYRGIGGVKIEKPQLEKGTVATPFTPYIPDLTQARLSVTDKNGTKEYTPKQDGTVESVSVVGYDVNMQGEGLYTNVKYLADTKKYIDNKFNELTKAVTTAQALALEV